MRPSFLALPTPYLCCIVYGGSLTDTLAEMKMAEHDGAQAFMVDLSYLAEEERTDENLKKIFHSTGRPCMPLCYRSRNFKDFSDEERMQLMLRCIDAGAAGVDIMGDLFDPSPDERTQNPAAIEKQMRLIERVHEMGAEALMSSHTNRVMTREEVLRHMADVKKRGVDIVKLVAVANTKAELLESLSTTAALADMLKSPFVHLCNGKYARLQRYIAPMLGACLTFGVQAYTPRSMGNQPLIASAREVLRELNWATSYPED